MPYVVTFNDLTDVSICIEKDPSGLGQHKVRVRYKWRATNGETREQPELNIFPWLQRNDPEALAQITAFYDAVVRAVKDRDGLS
ncbi:MAG: hypothetical protein ACUVXG_13950 [Anaerolineae bacterium]